MDWKVDDIKEVVLCMIRIGIVCIINWVCEYV